jgi:hypothetical protein
MQNARCSQQIQTHCVDSHDLMSCGAVSSFCTEELESPVWTTGRNPYDLRGECKLEDLLDTLCYPETKWVHRSLFLCITRVTDTRQGYQDSPQQTLHSQVIEHRRQAGRVLVSQLRTQPSFRSLG